MAALLPGRCLRRGSARAGVMTRRALAQARGVKLLVLDVDGVLTDNTVGIDGQGRQSKRFNIPDGLGLKLAQQAGLEVAVISGLDNTQAKERLRHLGVTAFHGGHLRKLPVLEDILESRGLAFAQAAYMGDDWLDASPMSRVGLAMAPCDAQPEVLRLAAWIAKAPGGGGAVREAVRFLLQAQGKHAMYWRAWQE